VEHGLPLLPQPALISTQVRAREGCDGGFVDQEEGDDDLLDLRGAGGGDAGSVVAVVVVGCGEG